MIYTRFSDGQSEDAITIIGGDIDKGHVDIKFADGSTMETFIAELKADGGFNEICEAINQANKQDQR